jgi:thiosulfate/3-mercaptopyruvate sulfurtransferase
MSEVPAIAFAPSLSRLSCFAAVRSRATTRARSAAPCCSTMSNARQPSALISAAELAKELDSSNAPQLLDASWYMPGPSKRDAQADFENDHLPGAKRFDIDAPGLAAVSDLPHMMPLLEDPAELAAVTKLVPSQKPLVVYAQGAAGGISGFIASARVWLHFRAMGHPNVRVLDGGLWNFRQQGFQHQKADDDGGAVVDTSDAAPFTPKRQRHLIWDIDDVSANASDPEPRVMLLDARPQGRFDGSMPEPRPNLNSGHVPGSRSLPASECVDASTGLLKSREKLAALLQSRNISKHRLYAVTCGSGVTAAVVALALHELGHVDVAIYDGSWSEYGRSGMNVKIEKP